MSNKCDNCPLLFCDFVSPDCKLRAEELARVRPDLLGLILPLPSKKPSEAVTHKRSTKAETIALGFKKYDPRRKFAIGFKTNIRRGRPATARQEKYERTRINTNIGRTG